MPHHPHSPSRRPGRMRAVAAAAASALVAGGLAVLGTVGSATAAEVTVPVTWTDCEVRKFPFTTNQRVAQNLSWSTGIRFDHPTPIPAGQPLTTELEFVTPFPGGLIPESMEDAYVDTFVELTNGIVGPLQMSLADQFLGTYDATVPFALEAARIDTSWPDAGAYPQRPSKLELLFTGVDGDGEFLEFLFRCDRQVNPPSLMTVFVYNLAAPATATVDSFSAKQGQAIRVRGTNLLTAAPTSPPARATVLIGGVVAGTLPIDPSGAVNGVVRVPAFARPGAVQVQLRNGGKVGIAPLTVTALKGKVTATPKAARSGGKVTLKGSAFKPGESVRLTLKGGRGSGTKSYAVSAKVKANGTFSKAVKLRRAAKGTWRVTATGTSSARTARTTVKVR